nr:RNA-directed DNA polymerase, eukaryota, reverse transcriptase zinc-binding domain protein [Tanacetum cinerariifolium]
MLWEYLMHVMASWKGDVIIMGDFNEVRYSNERFGSNFNVKGANTFNLFIIQAGLEEIPLGGCSFTWCHKSGSKMSKLDRFLVSESLLSVCPTLSSITLDRNNLAIRGVLEAGKWIENPDLVKKEFLNHFKNRFGRPNKTRHVLVTKFPPQLNSMQRMDMEADVTIEEIKNAVWDCGTNKSLGPNEFSFDFYRRFWYVIQKDVMAAVKCFFHYRSIPKGCNSSFKALIPKIHGAKMVKDFRPISLIGSLYKIIAKILANQMVTVLGDVINEIQSAFVTDRQILDGPFILNEVLQWCKLKKKQSFIFKIDFEKAYDSVRWDYLEDVIKKFGFGEKWCKWIRECLRSSWGSVIVNGSPTEEFQFFKGLKQEDVLKKFGLREKWCKWIRECLRSSWGSVIVNGSHAEEFQFFKGLKQGDPLSSFLFILIMESLHLTFQNVVDAGLLVSV